MSYRDILSRWERELETEKKVALMASLASVLEPIPEKQGCTTRSRDAKESKKLEYFLISGVNIWPSIEKLARYVLENGAEGAYRIFPEAVVAGKWRRGGGKINQGIVEYLFPIIITQLTVDREMEKGYEYVLGRVPEVLSRTSQKDVENLIRGKRLANDVSRVEKKYVVREHALRNVYEYYLMDARAEISASNMKSYYFNAEVVKGFPLLRRFCDHIFSSSEPLHATAEIYSELREETKGLIGCGTLADIAAVSIHLFLAYSDRELI